MVDLLGCAGHQQNAEIAGKITIMRESFRPSRQISKGSRVKAAKHQAGSGSLRYHTHSRRILLAIWLLLCMHIQNEIECCCYCGCFQAPCGEHNLYKFSHLTAPQFGCYQVQVESTAHWCTWVCCTGRIRMAPGHQNPAFNEERSAGDVAAPTKNTGHHTKMVSCLLHHFLVRTPSYRLSLHDFWFLATNIAWYHWDNNMHI